MTSLPADTPPRPWDFVQRGLAAFGISGRGLVIFAPALWLTLFFLVPLAVVFGISLSVKQFGQPPYSDLLTTEGGTVQLTLHLSNYLKLIEGSVIDGGFWFNLVFNLAVAVLALWIARDVSRPVLALAEHTKVIAAGDYARRIDLQRADELGELANAFNAMSAGLAERDRVRDLLDKNVSPEVAAQLLRDGAALGGEEREVTILFADLRGFTTMSEKFRPSEEQVVSLIDKILEDTKLSPVDEG